MKLSKVFTPGWLLAGLLLLAFAVRIIGAVHTPPAPYWEEVALGYDAYSLLLTGADHQGNAWPIVAFPSFGDFKPSGYFYALLPSIAVFGLSTFAVRLPALLASSAITFFVYLWARDLTNNRWIGLTSALLWAVQPWGWWLGRIGFEVNLATFFLISGSYLFWKGMALFSDSRLNTKRLTQRFFLLVLPATGLLAASMYTYHGARALAPLFAFFVAAMHVQNRPRLWAYSLITALLAIGLISPILLASRSPVVQQRIAETSIFSDPAPVKTANRYREIAGNTLISRVVFHRNFFRAEQLLANYASHLSPAFLFTQGDKNPRHSSQFLGLLYPWEALTIVWGIIGLWSLSRWRLSFLAGLTLLSPVAAMFTHATPHALRAFPLAIWLAIFSGIGLVYMSQWGIKCAKPLLKGRNASRLLTPIIGSMVLAIIMGSASIFAFYQWQNYPVRYSHEWQYGYEELISKMRAYQKPEENLFVSREYGRPSMYVLFYEKVDPKTVQAASPTLPKDQRELLAFKEWSFFDGQKHETGLHAASPRNTPSDATIIDTVTLLNGEIIWNLYR